MPKLSKRGFGVKEKKSFSKNITGYHLLAPLRDLTEATRYAGGGSHF